jgi:hypothetical protein
MNKDRCRKLEALSMSGLASRLSKIEQRFGIKTVASFICICRARTCFHNAKCFNTLLEKLERVCPIHGFRELGMFWFMPSWRGLRREDNQFCPCQPHPWRSFALNGPHTWEAQAKARAEWLAWQRIDNLSFDEEKLQLEAVLEKFYDARLKWYEASKRHPPSLSEIVKLGRERLPRFRGR